MERRGGSGEAACYLICRTKERVQNKIIPHGPPEESGEGWVSDTLCESAASEISRGG